MAISNLANFENLRLGGIILDLRQQKHGWKVLERGGSHVVMSGDFWSGISCSFLSLGCCAREKCAIFVEASRILWHCLCFLVYKLEPTPLEFQFILLCQRVHKKRYRQTFYTRFVRVFQSTFKLSLFALKSLVQK